MEPEPRPELRPPATRRGHAEWAELILRIVLLVVLVTGMASATTSVHRTQRRQQDLLADLSGGRVRYLEYERGSGQPRAHWVAGSWWSWNQADLDPGSSPLADGTYPLLRGGATPSPDPALQWLEQQARTSPHGIAVTVDDGSRPRPWVSTIVWQPLQWVVGVAWVGAFLMMLGRRTHRYANRWAWFWLFTIGQAGALVYLLVEPHHLWRPPSPPGGPVPVRGGGGLVLAVVAQPALWLVVVGVAAVL